jgi:hypothetical protein
MIASLYDLNRSIFERYATSNWFTTRAARASENFFQEGSLTLASIFRFEDIFFKVLRQNQKSKRACSGRQFIKFSRRVT